MCRNTMNLQDVERKNRAKGEAEPICQQNLIIRAKRLHTSTQRDHRSKNRFAAASSRAAVHIGTFRKAQWTLLCRGAEFFSIREAKKSTTAAFLPMKTERLHQTALLVLQRKRKKSGTWVQHKIEDTRAVEIDALRIHEKRVIRTSTAMTVLQCSLFFYYSFALPHHIVYVVFTSTI